MSYKVRLCRKIWDLLKVSRQFVLILFQCSSGEEESSSDSDSENSVARFLGVSSLNGSPDCPNSLQQAFQSLGLPSFLQQQQVWSLTMHFLYIKSYIYPLGKSQSQRLHQILLCFV